MAYANSSCFKSRAHHQAGAGRGHHPVDIASALCRVGLSHCRGRLRSRRHPRACIARPNHLLAVAACALCLAAARIANRRVALGPRPCSARALLCATMAVSPPGPAFASPAATWYHAWTPLAACALVYGLLRHLLDVVLRCPWAGTTRRRAMPRFVVCCCGRASGCREHALRFPMARQVSTER